MPWPSLPVGLHIPAENGIHAGLIAPTLRLEPSDHIDIELRVDRRLRGRQPDNALCPIVSRRRRIFGIGLRHALDLLLGQPVDLRPISTNSQDFRYSLVRYDKSSFLRGLLVSPNKMILTSARIKSYINNASSKINKHVKALFPIVVSRIFTTECKSAIKHRLNLRKIIEVIFAVRRSLVVVPGTRFVLAHARLTT